MQATARHHLTPLQYFEGVVWVLWQPTLQKIVEYFLSKTAVIFYLFQSVLLLISDEDNKDTRIYYWSSYDVSVHLHMLLKTCRSILSVVLQNKCSEEFHKIPTKDLNCENFLKNKHLAKGSFQRNFTNFTYLQNTSKHKIRFRNIAF